MTPTDLNAVTAVHGALLSTLDPKHAAILASKSTEREAQKRKLALLLGMRAHHTYELRRMGISHPAGRVQNLEEDGYVISSDRVTVVDENGFAHPRVALYGLVSSPGKEGSECKE
jgi:hypothetical protein